jgi:hypothetical protein
VVADQKKKIFYHNQVLPVLDGGLDPPLLGVRLDCLLEVKLIWPST